jgi:hypothetical protein
MLWSLQSRRRAGLRPYFTGSELPRRRDESRATRVESRPLSAALLCVMTLKRIFPAALLFCNLGSSVACAVSGDWRRAVYWAASSVCIAAVSL